MEVSKGLLFMLLVICIHNSSCTIKTAYDIGTEVWKLYLMIDQIKFNTTLDENGCLGDRIVANQEIKNQIDNIHKKIDRIEEFMNPKTIKDSFKSWPFNIMLYKCVDILELFVLSIDEYYNEFRHHMNESNHQSDVLNEFLQSLIPNLQDRIQLIRMYIIEGTQSLPEHGNIVYAISGPLVIHKSDIYASSGIMSHVLLQLFRLVIIAEMKVNIMSAIANVQTPQTADGSMNFFTKEKFVSQFGIYVNLFSLNLQMTDTLYSRARDPAENHWIRDKSFYELEGTFQTTIFRYHWMKCKFDSCEDVWTKKKCNARYYDTRSGCSGDLTQCVYLSAIQACVLKAGPYKLKYLNSSELGLFGSDFNCSQDNGYLISDGVGWDLTHAACACTCSKTDNKISLFIMSSRMESNMVITGIRFVRKNQILYIQPREGKLEADGHIRKYSEKWIPILSNPPTSKIQSINKHNIVFFFDDLLLPAGFVLTGVKFNKVIRGNLTGFAIKIFGAPFDFTSGQLNLGIRSLISQQESTEIPGHPLVFDAISSLHTVLPHTISPANIKYVRLTQSNVRDDVGQATLPLFDAVPVVPQPQSPLCGIGMFHKGVEGYAGFISLRVFGIGYAKYFMDFESTYMKNGRVLFNHSQNFS